MGSQTLDQIVDRILALPESTRFMLLAPKARERKGEYKDLFDRARKDGFVRVRVDGHVMDLEQKIALDKKLSHTVEIVIDRLVMKPGVQSRLSDSVETALNQGDGVLIVSVPGEEDRLYSAKNACLQCGRSFDDLTPQHFSFNHPIGMCPECDGLGRNMELDPELLVPDPSRSIVDGAVVLLKNLFQEDNKAQYANRERKRVETFARKYSISLTKPWKKLSKKAVNLLLYGDKKNTSEFLGFIPEIERWFANTSSEGFRSYILETYMRRIPCESCMGGRLKPEALAVQFGGKHIKELTDLNVASAHQFFKEVELDLRQEQIAGDVLKEIRGRLKFLGDVGLGYLTLSRAAPSLSGGEAQRIRLASQIGSALVGVLYVLDEPSIGLHQRDNRRLIDTLHHLRDLGNTVLVVEHDMEMMESADYIVDFGPGAGRRWRGGRRRGRAQHHPRPSRFVDRRLSLGPRPDRNPWTAPRRKRKNDFYYRRAGE